MHPGAPALPSADEWERLGVRPTREVETGYQSRVFEAELAGGPCAVKLTDARYVDAHVLHARAHVVAELAVAHRAVVPPVHVGGELVSHVGGWFVTATPFVVGRHPDETKPGDAELMGRALAELHAAMAALPANDLPVVNALRTVGEVTGTAGGSQLLHGDVNSANMLLNDEGVHFFDLDECGHGPVEFDVASAIYMVMFDAEVNDGDRRRYDAFRQPFADAYREAADRSFADAEIDRLIGLRIAALGRWLDDLSTAPIGIRTSSPSWQATLRVFVARHTRT